MRLGTIRREALRLMFASYGDVLEEHTYAELADNPQYAPYLAAMDGSVNRAVLYMQSAGVLPRATCTLTSPVVTGSVATFNLAGVEDLERVVALYRMSTAQHTTCSYVWEGGTTLVVPLYEHGDYVLVYDKRWQCVDSLTPDDTELDLPNALAALLPYYIKAELYEEEDAAEAKKARAYFEQALAAFPRFGNTPANLLVRYGWDTL